jgi:hypothetical protein
MAVCRSHDRTSNLRRDAVKKGAKHWFNATLMQRQVRSLERVLDLSLANLGTDPIFRTVGLSKQLNDSTVL